MDELTCLHLLGCLTCTTQATLTSDPHFSKPYTAFSEGCVAKEKINKPAASVSTQHKEH